MFRFELMNSNLVMLTFANISCITTSESSQWQTISALGRTRNSIMAFRGVKKSKEFETHLPPCPKFSVICVVTMNLLTIAHQLFSPKQ